MVERCAPLCSARRSSAAPGRTRRRATEHGLAARRPAERGAAPHRAAERGRAVSAPPDRVDTAGEDRRAPRPRRSPARFVWAALFTVAAAIGVLPDLLFGLDRRSPFVQIVSFRWQLLVAGLVLLVVLGVVTLKARRAWPFTAGLAAVLLIGAGMVAPRVLPDPVPTTGTPVQV